MMKLIMFRILKLVTNGAPLQNYGKRCNFHHLMLIQFSNKWRYSAFNVQVKDRWKQEDSNLDNEHLPVFLHPVMNKTAAIKGSSTSIP